MRDILEAELRRRQTCNPRYSLRAFASRLGTHHSTLSQILQSRRRLTRRTIQLFGRRLNLSNEQIRGACLLANCASIGRLVLDPRFRADSRWIAVMAGIQLDEVNLAIHWLLHSGQLTMTGPQTWNLKENSHATSCYGLAGNNAGS